MSLRFRSGSLVDNRKYFMEVRIWEQGRKRVNEILYMLTLK